MRKNKKYVFILVGYIFFFIYGSVGCSSKNSTGRCLDRDLDKVCAYGADNIKGNADDDCDDSDAAIHPNATEVCDHKDNDCDGNIDESDAADAPTWYRDLDEDGYGDPDTHMTACSPSQGYVSDNTDCDDTLADVWPGAFELTCDGIDNDCDPVTPDRPDRDEDEYDACVDCDDQLASLHPHAIELPKDAIDQNCDGSDRCQDLNCDGWADMVISNVDRSYIYWGSSSGFTQENRTELLTLGAKDNSVADLNGDGYLDIVFSNHTNGSTYHVDSFVYWGHADGFREENRTGLSTTGAWGNSVADLNNDGYLDIVFSNTRDDEGNYEIDSYVYWGSKIGFSSTNRTELPTLGAAGSSTADLNGDGYIDIVFSNHQDGATARIDSYIYWGSACGFAAENRTALPTLGSVASCLADLNDDDLPDIVFSNRFDDNTFNVDSYVYWGSQEGFLVSLRDNLPTIGTQACSIADLDNDGYAEIVFSNANEDQELDSYIYWGSQGGYAETNRTGLPMRAAGENQIADIDEDGFLDIVFSCGLTNPDEEYQSVIYWGSSTGYSSQSRTSLPFAGIYGLSIAGAEQSLPATETNINLSVDKILMSQGVDFGLFPQQDLGSVSVPRIDGRPTLVRAFLKVARADGATLSVTARLHGELSGAPLPGSPLEASLSPVPLSPSTDRWADSFNFVLPTTWTVMGASFYFEIDPEDEVEESDETDNRAPMFGKLSFGFEQHDPFDLMIVPVIQDGLQPDPDAYAEIEKWTQWVYPVPYVNAQIHTPVTYTGEAVAANGTNWSNVLDFVTTLRGTETSRPDLYYYGVINTGYLKGVAGIAWVPYSSSYTLPVAVGTDAVAIAGMTAVHEIGHNHGRHHVPGCNDPASLDPDYPYPNGRIGVLGWKPDTANLLDQDDYADLMSYCEHVWVSDYNYRAFFDWEVATQNESYASHQTTASRVFYLSGSMMNGRIVSARAFDLPNHPETPDRGEHLLELFDEEGNLVTTKHFTTFASDSLSGRQAFIVKVDRTHLAIKGYRIIDPRGRVLTNRRRNTTPPRAEITYAGPTGFGTSVVTWKKNKDQPLLQIVMVYNNASNRWEVRSLGTDQNLYEWIDPPKPPGQTHVRVILSDGILSDITETTF